MWAALIDHFRRYPAQEKIVRLLISQGLRVRDGRVYCGDVELSDSAVARAADVDRRIVSATVRTIEANKVLAPIFSHFSPTLHMKEVAPALGWGVLEIVPDDPDRPGILAGISAVFAEQKMSIRQAILDDPFFTEEPRIIIVTEKSVPNHLVPALERVPGVRAVNAY